MRIGTAHLRSACKFSLVPGLNMHLMALAVRFIPRCVRLAGLGQTLGVLHDGTAGFFHPYFHILLSVQRGVYEVG